MYNQKGLLLELYIHNVDLKVIPLGVNNLHTFTM